MTPELHDEAYGLMLGALAEGFDDEATIIEETLDLLSVDDLDDATLAELAEQAPAIFRAAAFEHEREKVTWPAVTDCDRLDAAFDDLNQRGIVARHHWWCCSTCGHAAMPAEMKRALEEGRPARGYAFYHVQDTERAVDGGGMYLGYSSIDLKGETALVIARELVEVLTAHGLKPSWNGDIDTRILVPMDWKRRARPARWIED